MIPQMVRSATLARQVFIYGRVRDGLTPDVGLRGGLAVRLIDRDSGQDYPLRGKVQPDATYAFYGLPQNAFPLLAARPYHLRVEASARGFIAAGVDFDLAQTPGQPAVVTRAVPLAGIEPIVVQLFTAELPRQVDLTLNRSAVRLRGRVVRAANPAQGISGAMVQAGAQSVPTDANGFFAFINPLPVALVVPVTVTAADFDTKSLDFEADFTQPVNELVIALTT